MTERYRPGSGNTRLIAGSTPIKAQRSMIDSPTSACQNASQNKSGIPAILDSRLTPPTALLVSSDNGETGRG